jgi:glycosyltransferase involved in cell wall biosynthesis
MKIYSIVKYYMAPFRRGYQDLPSNDRRTRNPDGDGVRVSRTVASANAPARVEITIQGGADPSLVRVRERLRSDPAREDLTVDDGEATGTWRLADDALEFVAVANADETVTVAYECDGTVDPGVLAGPDADVGGGERDPAAETTVTTSPLEGYEPSVGEPDRDQGSRAERGSPPGDPDLRAADGGPGSPMQRREPPRSDGDRRTGQYVAGVSEPVGASTGPTARSRTRYGDAGHVGTDGARRPDAEEAVEERPGVGFVASASTIGALARAVFRARDLGYEVFVTRDDTTTAEAIHFVRQVGARLVRPADPSAGRDRLHRELAAAADEAGLCGLVVHDPRRRVDYDDLAASLAASQSTVLVADSGETLRTDLIHTLAAIPAYNESGTIADVVATASEYVDEVLVIDDGSTDGTVAAAERAGADVVEHNRNRGYGGALKTAFREAWRRDVDRMVTLDADGQHDPGDVPRLFEALEESDAAVAIGSRYVEDGDTDAPLYRHVGLTVVNVLTNASMGLLPWEWLSDTQSGFRAYDRRALLTLARDDSIGDGMNASIDVLYHAHWHDYDVAEVGIEIDYDVANASSHNPLTHGLSLLNNIVRTVERKRPLTVLGLPGFLGAFVGVAFGYWSFRVFLATGSFPVGLAITSVFFCLSGFLTCFTAVILHALNTHLTLDDVPGRRSSGGLGP